MELFVSRLYRPIASCRGSAIPGNKLFRTIVVCSVVEKRAFHSIKWNAWNLGQTPFHPLLLIFLIFLLFCCRWGQEEPKRKEGGGGGGDAIATTRKSIYPRRKKERKEEKKSFYYYQENYVARDVESIYFHNRRIIVRSAWLAKKITDIRLPIDFRGRATHAQQ